ncbi:hypothetical protein BDZ91DRAFT_792829 [Kalaharituber pfeilii]|nr:hypothetical protein BDZ91DRAFT_792829 [Kalaharituber pfeilii]
MSAVTKRFTQAIVRSTQLRPISAYNLASLQQARKMSSTQNTNPGNFANRPKEEVRGIASKGGHASGAARSSHTDTKESQNITGTTTHNTNPGNFANRPKEEVREIASKGGKASHSGGFASMDPEKQREIASMGGKASSGSFEKGSERAREAGRKGGSVSSRTKDDDDAE